MQTPFHPPPHLQRGEKRKNMKKHPYKRFIDYLFGVIHLCEISFKYSSTFPKKEVK